MATSVWLFPSTGIERFIFTLTTGSRAVPCRTVSPKIVCCMEVTDSQSVSDPLCCCIPLRQHTAATPHTLSCKKPSHTNCCSADLQLIFHTQPPLTFTNLPVFLLGSCCCLFIVRRQITSWSFGMNSLQAVYKQIVNTTPTYWWMGEGTAVVFSSSSRHRDLLTTGVNPADLLRSVRLRPLPTEQHSQATQSRELHLTPPLLNALWFSK